MSRRKLQHNLWEELGYPKTIHVRVTPKASRNEICLDTLETGDKRLRVYVTTVPEDGKANKAVLALIAKTLSLSKSSLKIIQGETTRDKVIAINALPPQKQNLTAS
ncbi:MAG: DUF167 domain-containing protein [Alphaproteobacteria bacterium]|nr:DUF167 domain-containing protein [Alphaproteobacteria bacterium]